MDLKIDRYEVRRLIGQGAMGRIYLAYDPKLGREVAIKMLTASRGDEAVRRRFRLEARSIAALKHPNIVELYDYSGEDAGELFLVMEYLPGKTIHDYVNERGPMSEATALCIAHELALALKHAHEGKVVHRDIKPDNVLMHEGRLVLTDFGIVKQIAGGFMEDTEFTGQSVVLGTPGFMAPEQFTGKNIDQRTDLFAMGPLLYHLTTGHLPFSGNDLDDVVKRVRGGHYVDPRELSPLLSDGFCDLVDALIRPRPRDRIQSADELRIRVLELLRVHGVTEVRDELATYEKNPGSYTVTQRERGLEVLMRDLKIAIKDRQEREAQKIIKRMLTIAPIEDRVRGMEGLRWDRGERPRLEHTIQSGGRAFYLMLGLVIGLACGVVVGVELLILGRIPTTWVVWLEKFGDQIGLGAIAGFF